MQRNLNHSLTSPKVNELKLIIYFIDKLKEKQSYHKSSFLKS